MRALVALGFVLLCGCTSPQPAVHEVTQLKQDVHALKTQVRDITVKLGKTQKTAAVASSRAAAATSKATAAVRVGDDAKAIADRALDASQRGGTATPTIIQPREINHETSILP